jgi:glycosyltransferase involved in cell wall biosynthesis
MENTDKKNETPLKGISVVIPTRNRVTYAEKLLDSLHSELESFDESAEVVVVDSSEPQESEELSRICRKHGYEFHYVKRGISQARNHGIEAAKFPVVLFIDSDCNLVPGLLREHLESYTDEDIGGVLGLTNFTGRENWIWKIVERTPFTVPFSFAKRMDFAPWGPCTNISFRKDVLAKVHGFRTDFPFDFSGEDVDIGLRINKLDYKIRCNPRARVNHHREAWSNLGFCKKIFRWGRTGFHILTEHSYLSANDFPKFTTVSLLLVALFAVSGLLGMRWRMILLPLIWFLCVPAIDSLFTITDSKNKVSDFVLNYCSFWLVLVFELGAVFESLKNRSLLMLYKRHLYGSGQMLFEWKHKLIQNWTFMISLIILVLLSIFV